MRKGVLVFIVLKFILSGSAIQHMMDLAGIFKPQLSGNETGLKAAGHCNCGMKSAECGIAGAGQLGEPVQIVAAINDAGVEAGGGFQSFSGRPVAGFSSRRLDASFAAALFAMLRVCAGKLAASICLHKTKSRNFRSG